MTAAATLPATLLESRIVAIVRGGKEENVIPACEVLVETGVRCLEVTTNTPGWQTAIAALAGRADVLIGAGTVVTVAQVHEAADAGATFIVAPNTDVEVAAAAQERGMLWFPGAMTPTEILVAHRTGAAAVKVFPAGALGGARYLKDVMAPLSDIPLMPTGGVSLDLIPEYLRVGVVAVGLGSPLMGDALVTGDLEGLRSRAAAAVEAVASADGRATRG